MKHKFLNLYVKCYFPFHPFTKSVYSKIIYVPFVGLYKLNQIYINKIESPHELKGKILHSITSAPSNSTTESTLIFLHIEEKLHTTDHFLY